MIALQLRITTLNNSDWLAYLGGKYYDYPNGKASFYMKLDVHHGDTDNMLKEALRHAKANGLIEVTNDWINKPAGPYVGKN